MADLELFSPHSGSFLLRHGKNYEDTKTYALLDTKLNISCFEMKQKNLKSLQKERVHEKQFLQVTR